MAQSFPMPVPRTFQDRPYAARHFRAIVDHARAHHPFYRRWIEDPEYVPVISRAEYYRRNEEILAGQASNSSTSGSSGEPVRFRLSPERARMNLDDDLRFADSLGGPVSAVNIMKARGKADQENVFDVSRPESEQVAFLIDRREKLQTVAINTYPSNAEFLSRHILERGLDFSYITRFGLISETVEQRHRDLIREAFPNARIWSNYSSLEFGMISAQCPFEPEFQHIMAHKLGLEILRDDGTPCAEGERGSVVITDYFNQLTPFIRYEIGDLAVREACPCGRLSFPALSRVHGKVIGTILLPSGERKVFSGSGLLDIEGMRQIQITQLATDRFHLKIAGSPGAEGAVRERFLAFFGHPATIDIEPVESIPKGANGKFQYVISKL